MAFVGVLHLGFVNGKQTNGCEGLSLDFVDYRL